MRDSPRARRIHPGAEPDGPTPVVYWMHREHRAADNWALCLAAREAAKRKAPLAVAYALAPEYLGAGRRQFCFLLRGLRHTARTLEALSIPFLLRLGPPESTIPALLAELGAGLLVTDFDPLRIKRGWTDAVARAAGIEAWEVDGRNVVPAWLASDKREYMARTLRPKLHRLLPEFLDLPPAVAPHPHRLARRPGTDDLDAALARIRARPGPEETAFDPGEDAALRQLDAFVSGSLGRYADKRNTPSAPSTSRLSPWLHFGQISAIRAALTADGAEAPVPAKDAFLEQLIVRRELAENFCLHTPEYDTTDAFPDWARQTIRAHAADPRPALYTPEQFEAGQTHDELWNAAQAEMVRTGHMHGWLRMYWAKKIFEWSPDAAQAVACAVDMNDRHQLDGRDPNGYAGIAWAMGGVHDRPWPERPVFGTLRSMTYAGARRKFDVGAYVRRFGADGDG